MLAQARAQRVDVVYGVRSDRSSDSAFKRLSAKAFYRLIRILSGTHAQVDAGDYRLMSRATVDAVNSLPEHHRVLRFVVPALGFPSTSVTYRRDERAAGRSKYPLSKMIRLSLDSVTGFSTAPLRAATWLGLLGGLAAIALLAYALVASTLGQTLPGWTSTVVAVAGVGAVQLLCVGILGEYVGRMYAHLQARPTYFVAYDSLTGPVTDADEPSPSGSRQA
jgi:dolichol-phosphate mannosyltransferase